MTSATFIPHSPTQVIDPMAVLNQIFTGVDKWQQIVQAEATKRYAIAAQERTLIEGIHAQRDLLLTHLDSSFDERRQNFRDLFAALDRAMSTDPSKVSEILAAVTTLALKNPFADLADAETVTANLHAKDYTWQV
jgi:hypothetical protein